jgi:hypothetical protein
MHAFSQTRVAWASRHTAARTIAELRGQLALVAESGGAVLDEA